MEEIKYVAYYRVSTKKQKRSGLGLESQKAIVEHFAEKDKATIVKEYIETESGKEIINRPELQQAINFCLNNNCFLVVAKLDRLSRDVEHIFQLKKKLGKFFISCDLPNTDSLTLSIFAGIAQRERELISIRTKAALKAKKKRGAKLGKVKNFSTEGRKLGSQKTAERARQNPNNKRALSLIIRCRNEGMSYEKIANELNKNSFRTANGKPYFHSTVRMLYHRNLLHSYDGDSNQSLNCAIPELQKLTRAIKL